MPSSPTTASWSAWCSTISATRIRTSASSPPTPSGTPATIEYLSQDRSAVVANGVATTSSGVFVSPDAPFGTAWSTKGGGLQIATGYGGLVEGKVSVLVALLQLAPPVIGP